MSDRILLLSRSVPPQTSGSAIIAMNLAKQFTRDEMVVAGERVPGRPPVEWRDEWPRVLHLTSGLEPGRRGARWLRCLEVPRLVVGTGRLVRREGIGTIIAVFPNEYYLLAGYLTACRANVRLYAYFHNTYLEQRRGGAGRFAAWLQPRVFARASHVFVISEGIRELYGGRYPELPCSVLPHSFCEPIPPFQEPPAPGDPVRFVISGNVNATCEDAGRRVCDAVQETGGTLALLTGQPSSELTARGLLRPNVTHGPVSRDHLLGHLRQADIAVLPHGFVGPLAEEEYRTIFPTKAIEYLICGRPILAHTPAECFLTRFLRRHGCALVVDEPSVPSLCAAIGRLRSEAPLRAHLVRNALKAAEAFRAPRVAEELRRRLAAAP